MLYCKYGTQRILRQNASVRPLFIEPSRAACHLVLEPRLSNGDREQFDARALGSRSTCTLGGWHPESYRAFMHTAIVIASRATITFERARQFLSKEMPRSH